MSQITFNEQETGGRKLQRQLLLGAAGLVGLILLWLLYRTLTDIQGVPVAPPPVTNIDLLPPPPPPPPPPEPETKPPEPTEAPTPTPQPQPEAPAPMKMDAPPQAGNDGFGVPAGSGGGTGAPSSAGTCLGANCGGAPKPAGGISDAFYSRYLSGELQQRVQREGKVNRFVFSADFAIWITASGAVSRVQLVRGSGDERRDQLLASVLNRVSGLNAPPPSLRFPQRITVRGRKSA